MIRVCAVFAAFGSSLTFNFSDTRRVCPIKFNSIKAYAHRQRKSRKEIVEKSTKE